MVRAANHGRKWSLQQEARVNMPATDDKYSEYYHEALRLEQWCYNDWLALKRFNGHNRKALRDAAQAWSEAQAVVLTLFRDEIRRGLGYDHTRFAPPNEALHRQQMHAAEISYGKGPGHH